MSVSKYPGVRKLAKEDKFEAFVFLGSYETEEEAALVAAQLNYILWQDPRDEELIEKLGGVLPEFTQVKRLPRKQATDFSLPNISTVPEVSELENEEDDLTNSSESASIPTDGNN